MCEYKDFDNLHLCYLHRGTLHQELEAWHKFYLPVGEHHIDGGAGCGETVQFYLNHGAKKVLAIESDNLCYENLLYNFGKDERVMAVHFRIDSMKWDIEGSEIGTVFEAHKPYKVITFNGSRLDKVSLNKIVEDWGSPTDKLRRKISEKIKP